MTTQRYLRAQIVKVEVCERCKSSHEFPIEIIFDEEVSAIGLARMKNETYDIVLVCPTTNENIVVAVPVSLYSMQTFVRIQPKR